MKNILLLLLTLFADSLAAQLTQTYSGLKRTQLSYLHTNIPDLAEAQTNLQGAREIATSGSTIKRTADQSLSDQLVSIRQQLLNLPAFHRADYQIDTSGTDTLVHWRLEESRTLFPLFNFGGVRGNFHFLLGFNDIHWQGKGQQLTAYYQNNDGEHNYYLGLRNPALKGGRWGYRLETSRYAAIEPLYFPEAAVNYQYANLNFGANISYSPQPNRIIEFGVSTFRERYRKLDSGIESPGPIQVNQQKLLFKVRHQLNHLNTHQERISGSDFQTNAQLVYNLRDRSRFGIILQDFRRFILIGGRGNLAARLRLGVSTNDNSPFAPFVLDSQVNIRGSGNRIDRGTAQAILNLEYRHSVWRDRRDRFAAQLVLFSDLGNWRSPGGALRQIIEGDNLRHFVGLGTRLISLKSGNAAIRLDYGVDLRNSQERGLVVGFGQYF